MTYLWLKAFHIMAMISWMAGLLYLPRLFVYHAGLKPGTEASQMLKIMERRLLRYIMNPAMIVTFALGIALIFVADSMAFGWMHMKLLLVLILAGLHGMMAKYRKDFERDQNTKSPKFYRVLNEIPAVLMVVIVLLAVLKPF